MCCSCGVNFIIGSIFRGMDPVVLVKTEWFDYNCPSCPGGVLLRGLHYVLGDKFFSIEQLVDVPGTLNPVRSEIGHDDIGQEYLFDYFLLEFPRM
jgi:hypothetical protein